MDKDGGPAFPNTEVHGPSGEGMWQGASGMTLRDYFAAKAMQGWLATFVESRHPTRNDGAEDFAKSAYALADAMLAERKRNG